jgi:hypothetical protein
MLAHEHGQEILINIGYAWIACIGNKIHMWVLVM